jgi:L-aspartate oxidase
MTSEVGVLRTADGMAGAATRLAELSAVWGSVGTDDWETSNVLTISTGLCAAAALREETRGSHWREDFPDRDDVRQSGHHDWWLAAGEPHAAFRPSAPTDVAAHEVPV